MKWFWPNESVLQYEYFLNVSHFLFGEILLPIIIFLLNYYFLCIYRSKCSLNFIYRSIHWLKSWMVRLMLNSYHLNSTIRTANHNVQFRSYLYDMQSILVCFMEHNNGQIPFSKWQPFIAWYMPKYLNLLATYGSVMEKNGLKIQINSILTQGRPYGVKYNGQHFERPRLIRLLLYVGLCRIKNIW